MHLPLLQNCILVLSKHPAVGLSCFLRIVVLEFRALWSDNMIITDYFRSTPDLTWDYALQ